MPGGCGRYCFAGEREVSGGSDGYPESVEMIEEQERGPGFLRAAIASEASDSTPVLFVANCSRRPGDPVVAAHIREPAQAGGGKAGGLPLGRPSPATRSCSALSARSGAWTGASRP